MKTIEYVNLQDPAIKGLCGPVLKKIFNFKVKEIEAFYRKEEFNLLKKGGLCDTYLHLNCCYQQDKGRFIHTIWWHALMVAIYADFGIRPKKFAFWSEESDLWMDACKLGDDTLALRLLIDGFEPDYKEYRRRTGRWYAKKYRANIPRAWAFLCRSDLKKKAAEAHKRFCAGGNFTERRAM